MRFGPKLLHKVFSFNENKSLLVPKCFNEILFTKTKIQLCDKRESVKKKLYRLLSIYHFLLAVRNAANISLNHRVNCTFELFTTIQFSQVMFICIWVEE